MKYNDISNSRYVTGHAVCFCFCFSSYFFRIAKTNLTKTTPHRLMRVAINYRDGERKSEKKTLDEFVFLLETYTFYMLRY